MLNYAVAILLALSIHCANGEESPFDGLGKKMTEAVKTKNLNLYKECWLTSAAFKEVVNKGARR
jgi:hypothetical protein